MRHPAFRLALLGCVVMAGCQRRPQPAPPAPARYTVGPAWQGDGYWFYPQEEQSYHATGLAMVDAGAAARPGRTTADGERYDPLALTAAHQTLQLPVMLRVTDMDTGHRILLRANDRGPGEPGRLLSLTPRAARLLGIGPGGVARVRIEVDDARSQALLKDVAGAPPPDAVAAPVGAVQEQSLMPGALSEAATAPRAEMVTPDDAQGPVTNGPPEPGRLWIDAGHFSAARYARRLALDLQAAVRQEGRGRSAVFDVRLGPFDRIAAADAALDRARSAGVTGARIIVE